MTDNSYQLLVILSKPDRFEANDDLHFVQVARSIVRGALTENCFTNFSVEIVKQKAAICWKSNTTTSRWYDRTEPFPDPGPYQPGETVHCPACDGVVEVTPVCTNERAAGRQYVARLAEHTKPNDKGD